jgi:hypothetical protein
LIQIVRMRAIAAAGAGLRRRARSLRRCRGLFSLGISPGKRRAGAAFGAAGEPKIVGLAFTRR